MPSLLEKVNEQEALNDAKNGRFFCKKMPDTLTEGESIEKMKNYRKDTITYLEVMNQIDRENIFSNLLYFFLDYDRNLLQKCCKRLFGVSIKKDAKIKREHHHVDIWIQDDENIIIIENKIHSGLNGKDGKQLENYKNAAKNEAKDCKIPKNHTNYFIIAPEYYHKISTRNMKVGKDCEYSMVGYRKIIDILKGYSLNHGTNQDKLFKDKINQYYEDFLRALLVHSEDSNMTKQKIVERRFFARLYQLDKKKGKNAN